MKPLNNIYYEAGAAEGGISMSCEYCHEDRERRWENAPAIIEAEEGE